jgi:hypothetical protein
MGRLGFERSTTMGLMGVAVDVEVGTSGVVDSECVKVLLGVKLSELSRRVEVLVKVMVNDLGGGSMAMCVTVVISCGIVTTIRSEPASMANICRNCWKRWI